MKQKSSQDLGLIVATAAVLFVIALICIGAMFYFKLAQVQLLSGPEKTGYLEAMNAVTAPFAIALVVLLGLCVPRRLLPARWLARYAAVLLALAGAVTVAGDITAALACVLVLSAGLQAVVLCMALAGSTRVHFEKTGYWVRIGSCLLHLGLILFVLDVFFYRLPRLHLALFWATTVSTTLGMLLCFYAEAFRQVFSRSGQSR